MACSCVLPKAVQNLCFDSLYEPSACFVSKQSKENFKTNTISTPHCLQLRHGNICFAFATFMKYELGFSAYVFRNSTNIFEIFECIDPKKWGGVFWQTNKRPFCYHGDGTSLFGDFYTGQSNHVVCFVPPSCASFDNFVLNVWRWSFLMMTSIFLCGIFSCGIFVLAQLGKYILTII